MAAESLSTALEQGLSNPVPIQSKTCYIVSLITFPFLMTLLTELVHPCCGAASWEKIADSQGPPSTKRVTGERGSRPPLQRRSIGADSVSLF